MILNFIQEAPTPHNNILLKECKKHPDVQLILWYNQISFKGHGFSNDLAYEVTEPIVYKQFSIDWKLLGRFIFRKEKFLMVGWTSPTTRLIAVFSFLLRKPLNMWFDMPNDVVDRGRVKNIFRNAFYFTIKHAPVKIFCVGKITVDYFARRGFNTERLVNLPIFVSVEKDREFYINSSGELQVELAISKSDFIISSGSRLLYEKGYDLVVEAINLLNQAVKTGIKVFIIGKGDQETAIKELIDKYQLQNCIRLLPWLPTPSFMSLIALSDIFIHPARFDAFGGTIYAMSVGTPVIGARTAGAALDRIEHGRNGFLYDAEDIQTLAKYIQWCFENRSELEVMGYEARVTALQWTPEQGAYSIVENIR